MFSEADIKNLWRETIGDFKNKFPDYYEMLAKAGWKARVENKQNSSFGWANRKHKHVVINLHMHKRSKREHIVDTMLHEVAHAIDFCIRGKSNHDSHWKTIASKIGATPSATAEASGGIEYKFVAALNKEDAFTFIRGYNRRPSGFKADAVMLGACIGDATQQQETLNKIWLYSWATWVKLCKQRGISPFKKD